MFLPKEAMHCGSLCRNRVEGVRGIIVKKSRLIWCIVVRTRGRGSYGRGGGLVRVEGGAVLYTIYVS